MRHNLVIINKVLEEHHTIRKHVKLVGDTVSDMEALFSLQNAYAGWSQSSIEVLSEKQAQLEQTLSRFHEGLRNHFSFEEEALSSLFGELLMKALLFEHRQISEKIDEAKITITNTKLEGLSREDVVSKKSHIQQMISNICQMVEEHATREETILRMIKRTI